MRAAASVAAIAVAGMFLSTALAQNSESAGGAAGTLAKWRQGPEVDPGPYLKTLTPQPVARKAAA